MANKAKFTDKYIRDLSPQSARVRVWDTESPYLVLDVLPTGKKVFRAYYRRAGKPAYSTIDTYGAITLKGARDAVLKIRAQAREGVCPVEERRKVKVKAEENQKAQDNQRELLLRNFLEQVYIPDAKRRGMKTIDKTDQMVRSHFADFLDYRLDHITPKMIEKWQTDALAKGLKPTSINRALNPLRAIMTIAVEKEYLEIHPLKRCKNLSVQDDMKERYLSAEEETRLRNQLEKRNQEKSIRLPPDDERIYADHIMPIILVALNTGMRRGEIFQLTWDNVSFKNNIITVTADTAKSSRKRYINMNKETQRVLEDWNIYSSRVGLVFPNPATGKPIVDIKSMWINILGDAEIHNFRFHDLRHTFASNLVMKGAPLYMVQKLLGHSTLEMTMRYAHLSPDSTAQAVALLD
jgi:integrase